jgi:chromosomal replication initiation ATPase DnaA
VFVGGVGLGKTHLVSALSYQAFLRVTMFCSPLPSIR